MVKTDRSDDADKGSLYYIGGILRSSEPALQYHHVTGLLGKIQKGGRCLGLKQSDWDILFFRSLPDKAHAGRIICHGYVFLSDPDDLKRRKDSRR